MQTIESLYPDHEISVFAVHSKLLDAGYPDYAHYLCECTISYEGYGSLAQMALILLQIDLREKYSTELDRLMSYYLKAKDMDNYSRCNQLYHRLKQQVEDIFEVLDDARTASISYNWQSALLDGFDRMIHRKANEIKENLHIDTLISHIESMSRAPYQQTDAIVIMCRIIQRLYLQQGQLDPTQIKQLTEMYKHLL